MSDLLELQNLIFDLKDKIPDCEYVKAMNILKRQSDIAKKVLIAIPQIKEIQICKRSFDLGVECIYITVTKEDYKFYDSLQVGGYFDISEYAPLKLLFNLGYLKYQPNHFCSFNLVNAGLYGKVIQIYNLDASQSKSSSAGDLSVTSSATSEAPDIEPFFSHVISSLELSGAPD